MSSDEVTVTRYEQVPANAESVYEHLLAPIPKYSSLTLTETGQCEVLYYMHHAAVQIPIGQGFQSSPNLLQPGGRVSLEETGWRGTGETITVF